jgi:hypothetical protein
MTRRAAPARCCEPRTASPRPVTDLLENSASDKQKSIVVTGLWMNAEGRFRELGAMVTEPARSRNRLRLPPPRALLYHY